MNGSKSPPSPLWHPALANFYYVTTFLQKGMVSKGVESVPSPVKNLVEWDPLLDHQAFFETVANQFIHVYGGNRNAVHDVDESELDKKDYVRDVFEELQTWEWQWGQTPEFTHTMKADFAWGSVVSRGVC